MFFDTFESKGRQILGSLLGSRSRVVVGMF